MMELSLEVPDDVFATFRRPKVDTSCPQSLSCQVEDSDILDFGQLVFRDDENWLCECSSKSETDLHQWLYEADVPSSAPLTAKSPKNIDTRTFTRPKKRFTRPSIEKYNEELYGSDKELIDSGIQLNGFSQDDSPVKPLHFDLTQTSSSVYFENMLANAGMADSFTNMSPPSLVNSMCSSTFQNLMESSFIKNDPELREIRDMDFTGSILQQEGEPMFQSITESFSSLNSDVPENFLKKVSFVEKGEDGDGTIIMMDATYAKEDNSSGDRTVILEDNVEDFQDAKASSKEDLNSTYQRRKPEALNSTFQRRKSDKPVNNMNATITLEPEKTPPRDQTIVVENVKRLLDRRPSPSLDLNRLSYLVDKNDQMNSTFTSEIPKRNSFGSTDSGENLDYMSLSSGSSKSSTMRSSDGINVIIEDSKPKLSHLARRSPGYHQIMSTPKPRNKITALMPEHEISPIRDRNSDPEMSSSESPVIVQSTIRKQKSVGNITQKITPPKNIKSGLIGSQPNLKITETRTIQRHTNLNSMGHALKGSYTSLKPTNTNLPVAPPPLDTTVTKAPVVAQVPPQPREVPKSQDAQFVKPQPPRSGLPRPVTGIPRPVSRIPGPRGVRPVSKSAGYQRH